MSIRKKKLPNWGRAGLFFRFVVISPIRLAYGVLTYFVKVACLSPNGNRDALNRVADAFCL